jgi:hypothetical protein
MAIHVGNVVPVKLSQRINGNCRIRAAASPSGGGNLHQNLSPWHGVRLGGTRNRIRPRWQGLNRCPRLVVRTEIRIRSSTHHKTHQAENEHCRKTDDRMSHILPSLSFCCVNLSVSTPKHALLKCQALVSSTPLGYPLPSLFCSDSELGLNRPDLSLSFDQAS